MKLKCLIVDDEPIAQNIMKGFINDMPNLEVFQVCNNAMEALEVLNNQSVDILFLDIEMPKITGLSFLKTISNPPATIITTAYRQFALDGFELNVVDYLLKPFSFERFIAAVNKVPKAKPNSSFSQKEPDRDFEFFKVNKKNIKVHFRSILYIEALSNYMIIHLNKGEQLVVYSSLIDISEKLPQDYFIRIHRSFLINISNILAFGKDYVDIGNKQLSIGNTYRKSFFEMIEKKSK